MSSKDAFTGDRSPAPRRRTLDIVNAGLQRRHARERRFRLYGKLAIGAGMTFLVLRPR